ncbi:hypothetical protein E4U22_001042 [Claviceps purpurea]|nr:hypothetical protein E4U28_000035 [Claviceps purpurea]KAG6321920.1 hypothetical protein E4U22_001042 [Claviceps purpurea]
MLCGISGEAPQEPVVSKKSGIVYEKRLIEQYIKENSTEPSTGEALTADDLVVISSSRIVRPRPPTLTSIPALLATFQNEWDTLALETYNLKEQLARTREELATALYQHDAAVRVIARLAKERDEARDSLSKVTIRDGAADGNEMDVDNAADGDEMVVDSVEALPDVLIERVEEAHQALSKGRKKRAVPEDWARSDDISSFEMLASDSALAEATSIDITGCYAALGGLNGEASIYNIEDATIQRQLCIGEAITSTLSSKDGSRYFFATSKGSVKVYRAGHGFASLSEHAGPVTGLTMHPSSDILGTVGADKRIILYDLATMKRASRAYADSSLTTCAFHPDGHLFAAGSMSGDVKLYMTTTLEQAVVFKVGAPVQALTFSENGFWLAAAAKDQTTVTVFDLRKEGSAATAKVLETGGSVECLAWDYSGQFLATGGPSGVTVQQYTKSSKRWSEPFRTSDPVIGLGWGESAKKLVTLLKHGELKIFGPPKSDVDG